MLEGLKVIELASYIAAPGACAILADWGADVIKIEPPAGDPMRQFFDSVGVESAHNPVFELDNRGKRGVVLDITKRGGRDAVKRLLADADVLVTNVRPAALRRAGLDPADLMAEHPRLIVSIVTGYGLEGPDAAKPGFDMAAFWSRAGVVALTAPKGAEPMPIRTGMGDHITSMATVGAVLAAVVERTRTGKGRLVETSLLRTGVYAIGSDLAIQLHFGRVASNRPRETAINPLNNFFKSADGRWVCLIPRQGGVDWPNIARAAGAPELAQDERFQRSRSRRDNGRALVAALDAAFGKLAFTDIAQALDAEDVVWAPVQTAAEVVADPQAIASGCFVESAAGGRSPAAPARFPGAQDGPARASPKLGQHTDTVLADLGYNETAIAELRAEGAIA